ncbi:MAG TPA: hypothetical protein VJV79_12990 [Polyangiaceae bacterium]|nr:hypothetical protein [Polyangiaceae bacterium]
MRELEPLSFDRALLDAARELERRKKTGEPTDDALPDFMLDEETLHWLRETQSKDPLAPSLELWLLRLREQAEFCRLRAELSRAHQTELHPIVEPEQARRTLSELLRLSLARPRERAAYLRGYFASSAAVAERVLRLWEERQLFAERLRAPLATFEVASESIAPAARALLTDTRSAFETLRVREPAELVGTLLAEAAAEGWPARLSQRTTLDLLGDRAWFHGLRLRPFAVPEALGAGSFLLALCHAGRALSDAANAQRSPFVLSRDVFDLQRNTVGALLGTLPLSPEFATRRLGLGPSRVRDQQRALARAVLVDLRVAAFRVLLRELLCSGKKRLHSELPELSHQALGFELPASAAGAFIRVRPRDSQRFAGALLAASRHETLLQTHDEDWFRNPRAIAELRAELSDPPQIPLSAERLSAGAGAALARVQALL